MERCLKKQLIPPATRRIESHTLMEFGSVCCSGDVQDLQKIAWSAGSCVSAFPLLLTTFLPAFRKVRSGGEKGNRPQFLPLKG